MGRAHEKRHICKCLISHAKNSLRVYNQKNSGYTKIRRKIRQQEIPKTDSRFLHIELLSREAWTSKDTKFFTPSIIIKIGGIVSDTAAFVIRSFSFLLPLLSALSILQIPFAPSGFQRISEFLEVSNGQGLLFHVGGYLCPIAFLPYIAFLI